MPTRERNRRRSFSDEFRRRAVKEVAESGRPISHVADELGLNVSTLGNWVRQDLGNSAANGLTYSISEAADELSVGVNTLRQWERQGLVRPARTAGNQRRYSEDDLTRLRRVLWLKRAKGMSAPDIARALDSDGSADDMPEAPSSGGQPTSLVGVRLRLRRRELGLTLREVAESVDLSISQLSAIERGTSNPSVAALQRLARLYGTSPNDLVQSRTTGDRLIRADERPVSLEAPSGIRVEQAAVGTIAMRPEVIHVPEGAGSDGSYEHAGEEFFYVLSGQLQVWIGSDERYDLTVGDCLYYPSTVPHRWVNPGPGPTQVLSVDTSLQVGGVSSASG